MASYATPAEYRAYLSKHSVTGKDEDAVIQRALDSATETVTAHTYRSFDQAENQTETFDVNYTEQFWIGDWATITRVTPNVPFTRGRRYGSIAGRPYRFLVIDEVGEYTVEGTRGWPSVPNAIKNATIEIAAIRRGQIGLAYNVRGRSNEKPQSSELAIELLLAELNAYVDVAARDHA